MNATPAAAVIGLGAMGTRVAERLRAAGIELTVWNRDPARSVPLAEAGARVAESPAAAARSAEVVLVLVADPAALEAVTEGPDGVAAGSDAATTVIQMSTVSPEAITRLAEQLPPGAGLLDAPVLGSLAEAESGTLRIFAGGEVGVVERWTPFLSMLGSVLPVGPLGAGTAAKLVANSTLFGALGVLGEALALADGLGLEREATWEVLAATPLAAQAERRRPAIESGDYPVRFVTISVQGGTIGFYPTKAWCPFRCSYRAIDHGDQTSVQDDRVLGDGRAHRRHLDRFGDCR